MSSNAWIRRIHPALVLAIGLSQPACGDPGGLPPDPPVTGASIAVRTRGADIDGDGYRVIVEGSDRGAIGANGNLLLRLDPGPRTIALSGLTSNCAVDGPGSRTATIVADEVAQVVFTVACNATSGVIRVVISGSAFGAALRGMVDSTTPFAVTLGRPAYVERLSAGEHVVSLSAPAGCTLETDRHSVIVTVGTVVRDTAEVTFSVSCVAALRVTAPTTGTVPSGEYAVWVCWGNYYCPYYGHLLGRVAPNGSLLAEVTPGPYNIWLEDLPSNCHSASKPSDEFSVIAADTLDVELPVTCT
jgi:hypothetical protein